MVDMSVQAFTEALAAKTSVPGGGGAVALAGAIGTALGSMVGAFTLGKKRYADVEADMLELMKQAQEIQQALLQCIQEDAEAFEPLSKAYGMSKEDPTRDAVLESCLLRAAEVPKKILDLCSQSLDVLEQFAKKGSRLMLSDAATGAALCRGALMGAAMNVKVNTRLMKDRDRANRLETDVDARMSTYLDKADAIFLSIYGRG